MNIRMARWTAFFVGFFAIGGFLASVSYTTYWMYVAQNPLSSPWMLVFKAVLLVILTGLLATPCVLMEPLDRQYFVSGVVTGSIVGVIISQMFPSAEFAANFALSGIVLSAIIALVPPMIFLYRKKKS